MYGYHVMQIDQLKDTVCNIAIAKSIQNQPITGDMFISIINHFLEQLRSNPDSMDVSLNNAWVRVVHDRSLTTEKMARKIYETKLLYFMKLKSKKEGDRVRTLLPLHTDVIMEAHEEAKLAAKSYFRSMVNKENI